MKKAMSGLAGVAAALATGSLFYILNLPLAWLLGPLLGAAAVSLFGLPVFAPIAGRRLGQLIVGTTIGLHVTAAVALSLVSWLPVMIVSALVGITLAAFLSVFLARLGGVDEKSAYYAMLPGGLSEMANIGLVASARPEPITLAQSLRVGLVVCLVPPLIISLGIDGGIYETHATAPVDLWMLPVLMLIACVGVLALSLARFGNPWMTGALLAVGTVSAFGWPNGQILPMVFALGQFMIGINVGARFRRDIIVRLPRMALASLLMILLLTVLLLGVAALVVQVTGLDLATAALAVSPGGLAEMATTAQVLHLGIVLITGFHIVRSIIVNGLASILHAVFERLGLFATARRLDRRLLGQRAD